MHQASKDVLIMRDSKPEILLELRFPREMGASQDPSVMRLADLLTCLTIDRIGEALMAILGIDPAVYSLAYRVEAEVNAGQHDLLNEDGKPILRVTGYVYHVLVNLLADDDSTLRDFAAAIRHVIVTANEACNGSNPDIGDWLIFDPAIAPYNEFARPPRP